MAVKKRIETIFKKSHRDYDGSVASEKRKKSKTPQYKFRPRRSELRGLEGVYPNPSFPDYPIHISCRFNDILRAGDTRNFVSCFRPEGDEKYQPFLRCVNPNWAIVFTLDKSGRYMGRTWIKYKVNNNYNDDVIGVYRMYGNKLRSDDVCFLLNSLISRNKTGRHISVVGGQPDDYIHFG